VSSLTQRGAEITLKALEAGAIDFVAKPGIDVARGLNEMLSELRSKVKVASKANVSHWKKQDFRPVHSVTRLTSTALSQTTDKVIAIGASTGGTEAIRHILKQLPADMPGIVIVQHMPPGFTSMFAKGLDDQCALSVKEAADGDRVMPGHVLIAPGDFHMTVRRSGGMYLVDCRQGEKVCGHRPSVEVLFQSVAKSAGANAIGIILTGMGSDGADGMLAMRQAGAKTMAQDEASSVVFGMPKVAHERGGAQSLVPLHGVAHKLMTQLAEKAA
jgi:two-component system chemotaxis response regulator CheB